MRIFYLVHDLGDAAVKRRVRFLRQGGAEVSLAGFTRLAASSSPAIKGPVIEGLAIGRTRNGRMVQRALSMAGAILRSPQWQDEIGRADIVIARNLEMLLVAQVVRRRMGSTAPLVYECLDIHRLMTRGDRVGTGLRAIEARLLGSCALLLVSSARFLEAYFEVFHRTLPPSRILENKVLASDLADALPMPPPAAPPWRIGWFGIIRCRRSLEMLAALVRALDGRVEVDIRGRPARDVIPEFDEVVAATPGLTFHGPYDRQTELPAIYGRVHFNWCLDFYEDGLNSAWLLPNRLYEGSLFGAVPIAAADVETGRWLRRSGCGLLLDAPMQTALADFFSGLEPTTYRTLRAAVERLDRSALTDTATSAGRFVSELEGLGATGTADRPAAYGRAA